MGDELFLAHGPLGEEGGGRPVILQAVAGAAVDEADPPAGELQDIQLQLGRISIAASQVAVDVAIGTFGPDTDLEDAINSAISGFEGDVSALEKSLRDPTTYYLDVAYGREIQSC